MTKLRMSWPNRITIGRILLIVPFVIAMLHINDPRYSPWSRYTALIIFLVMAISDGLDGWMARRNDCITRLGTFLDPLADKLLITCACLLLAAEKTSVAGMKLPDAVVVIIIGKDLYTTLGFLIIFLVTSEMKIVPAAAGKWSTTLQLAMVVATLLSPDITPLFGYYSYLVQGIWWATVVMAILTIVIYTRNGTRYLNEYEQRMKNHTLGSPDNTPPSK